MIIEVEMHMFQQGVIRNVNIPDEEFNGNLDHDLDLVFFWGQNDFQTDRTRVSVSAGDVIRFKNKRYLIKFTGFEELKDNEQLPTQPVDLIRRIL